jgi:hypothetical protein
MIPRKPVLRHRVRVEASFPFSQVNGRLDATGIRIRNGRAIAEG